MVLVLYATVFITIYEKLEKTDKKISQIISDKRFTAFGRMSFQESLKVPYRMSSNKGRASDKGRIVSLSDQNKYRTLINTFF